ncbi:MAG: CRTAC1 family protein [bacterium]|nr:CRTAC1 family protein [bacterium]
MTMDQRRNPRRLGLALTGALLAAAGPACEREPPPALPSPTAESSPSESQAESPAADRGLFTDVAVAAGLEFEHFIGASGAFYMVEIMAAGCALLDYDNDGDLDAYLLQGALLEPGKSLDDAIFPPKGPLPPRNRLFRNELISTGQDTGTLRFVDVTDESGAGDTGYAMGVATGDYDNDGDLDLYITNFGPDVMLANNGDGTFTDVTARVGLGDPRWTASCTFLDYNNDGLLDLFVVAYCDFSIATNTKCFGGSGARDYCVPKGYGPLPVRLYRNRGVSAEPQFVDVSSQCGIDTAYGHGLGVGVADFDGNGWLDIYVANDEDANQLWMNDNGRFTDAGLLSGTAFNQVGQPEAGMGVAVADFDDDADADLLLTHFISESNTLYENRGDTWFEDTTREHGLGRCSMPFTSFGVGFFDADHDADLDLFIASGLVALPASGTTGPYPYDQTNQLLINVGTGRYQDRSAEAGAALQRSRVSRGAAFGDVDNDGDVDILVCNNNGPAVLLRNDLADRQNWLTLRVIDGPTGRDAFGAVVQLTLSDGRTLTRYVGSGGSYCSADDPRIHFGWPTDLTVTSLEIALPGGYTHRVPEVHPQTIMTVTVDHSTAGKAP